MTNARILVVDDEPSIVDAVATSLRYEGFEVVEASTGREAILAAQNQTFSLMVLDVMLPDLDGFEAARRLRSDGVDTPIVFLTARDGIDDKRAGFGAGADDYITKPFTLAELILRVRAILNRTSGQGGSDQTLSYSDLQLDVSGHRAARNGAQIELTATEFALLRYFMLNPGRVLTKAQILENVWHYDFDGDSNICETYVSYLRKKLNEHGPPLIQTVRLVGYVLRLDTP